MPIFKKAFDKFEEKTLPLGEILLSSKEHWTFATASEFPNGRRSRGKLCWGLWEINLHEVPLAMERPQWGCGASLSLSPSRAGKTG